jgi:hypothetical protein
MEHAPVKLQIQVDPLLVGLVEVLTSSFEKILAYLLHEAALSSSFWAMNQKNIGLYSTLLVGFLLQQLHRLKHILDRREVG